MRRREFMALVGGAAINTAVPLIPHAQHQPVPVIGFLNAASLLTHAPMLAAFRRGLAEAGYVEGQNVAIEFRWAEGKFTLLPSLAAELVRRPVSLLVVGGGDVTTTAAKSSTDSIPIVFTMGADPVKEGIVRSLSRPEGNLTGASFFTGSLGVKRLEMLRELVPKASTIAVLHNPDAAARDAADIEQAVQSAGQRIRLLHARGREDIDDAFRSLQHQSADALLVVADPLFTIRREQIVTLSHHYRIPAIYPLREYVAAGGLLSYGARILDAYHQAGAYAGRILKGAKPTDLPVLLPTRFELVLNLRTAKALGLTVPPLLLARADEVIE